jgi:hypothetical protein
MKTYNGSEYLFQAEDHDEMISWIKEIKCNNNPDADVSIRININPFTAIRTAYAVPIIFGVFAIWMAFAVSVIIIVIKIIIIMIINI